MKSSSAALKNTLLRESAIHVQPRLIAEWEYNRFFEPTVTVTPGQSGDDEWSSVFGDQDSICLPNRPAAGIAKARLDSGVRPLTANRTPDTTRFYPASVKDRYGYWSSLQKSLPTAVNGEYAFFDPITVTVNYPEKISTNKIVVGFETGYALPVGTTIQVSGDGSTWETIASDPVVADDGTVTLWRGQYGGWDSTAAYDFPVYIKAVRLNVYSMDRPGAHVDVLQVSPRLESDLTPFLISYDVQHEISSPSFIAPMGQASSNTASVVLSNIDGRFNNNNPDSLYYRMVEKKVRFKLDIGIDATAQGGSKFEYVREFTMWTDGWGAQNNSTINVDLKDSSVILQEQTMPYLYVEDVTAGAVVWNALDLVGMTNYQYNTKDSETGQVIPFYWPSDNVAATNSRWFTAKETTKNKANTTIWEEFATLAEGTQTAIYFDEYDVLQVTTRRAMYDSDKAVDWNLDAVTNGTKLADVITTETSYDLTTNKVEINYKPCSLSDDQNGLPRMEQVWQPKAEESDAIVPKNTSGEDTVLLRAAPITKDILPGGTVFSIPAANAVYWPYESDVNIEGEILHYKGKEYGYYEGGVLKKKTITSAEAKADLDKLDTRLNYKNAFTGRLHITERGLYGSAEDGHKVKPDTYTSVITSINESALGTWTGGKIFKDGYVTLSNNSSKAERIHLYKHESQIGDYSDGKTVWYGTRVRFHDVESDHWNVAGLYFCGGDVDQGYYLEFMTTEMVETIDHRVNHNELSLLGMPDFGRAVRLKADNGSRKGYQGAVVKGVWYDLDLKTSRSNGDFKVVAYINGALAGSWTIPDGRVSFLSHNRFGVFVRGWTDVDVEYLYAYSGDSFNPTRDPDTTGVLDVIRGDYRSGFFQKEIKYNFKNITPALANWVPWNKKVKFPQRISTSNCIVDEFGPIAHEVREFTVHFDNTPVVSSYLYVTNSAEIETLWYESDASGATFMLANCSRSDALVNGEQSIINSGDTETINHTMFIYGRVVYTADNERTVEKVDAAAVRRQGEIRTEFTSRYIQTDAMATALGEWVLEVWATGIDEVTVEMFGNPLIQLGDLVTLNFPAKGMSATTHKYFVHGINRTYDAGYKTSLVLRRAQV